MAVILIGVVVIGLVITGLIIGGGIVVFLIGFSITFVEFWIVGRGVFEGFGVYGIDGVELFFEVDRFEKNVVLKIGNPLAT